MGHARGADCSGLGGSPEILDIVGVNVYHYSQVQLDGDKKRETLGPRDPRRKPLSELLSFAWDRYHRPIIIGETSGYQDNRAEWLRMTMEESLKALNAGVELHGVCLYPFVDVPDWWTQKWAKIGIYDVADKDSFERVPCDPYIQELRRWQKRSTNPRMSIRRVTETAGAACSFQRFVSMRRNGRRKQRNRSRWAPE